MDLATKSFQLKVRVSENSNLVSYLMTIRMHSGIHGQLPKPALNTIINWHVKMNNYGHQAFVSIVTVPIRVILLMGIWYT